MVEESKKNKSKYVIDKVTRAIFLICALIAVVETEIIVGSIITANTIITANKLCPCGKLNTFCIHGTITAKPNNPYNTDGIPAKSSTAGIIILDTPFGATSAMNIAVSNPIGTPIIKAPIVPQIDAIIIGSIPYF